MNIADAAPRKRRPILLLSAILLASTVACRQEGPPPEDGRALLAEIEEIIKTDAADDLIDELTANYDINTLGVAPKQLEEMRHRGHLARLQTLAIDIQLSDRDVSDKVKELKKLAAQWKVDLTDLEIRVEHTEVPITEEVLEKVLRQGFLREAEHWLAEFQNSGNSADQVANLEMVRQYLRQAEAGPEEIGVTDPKLVDLINRGE